MYPFLNVLKEYKGGYVVALSFVTTVVVINAMTDFAEKIISNPLLLLGSFVLFIFFLSVTIRQELWKNGKV